MNRPRFRQIQRLNAGATSFTAGRTDTTGQPALQSTTKGSAITYFVRDNTRQLISMVTATGSSPVSASSHEDYYLTDASDDVIDLFDLNGATTATYTYDPYGAHATATGADSAANPYRFASAYLDATGLYKMGARYYDPSAGRFTQQDDVSHTGDLTQGNRYAYAGDNPIDDLDPTGDSFSFGISGCLVLCVNVSVDLGDDGSFGITPTIGAGPDAGVQFFGTESTGTSVESGPVGGVSCSVGAATFGVEGDASGLEDTVGVTTDTEEGCEGEAGYTFGSD